MYQPHIQKLYEYFIHRVKADLEQINNERQHEGSTPLALDEGKVEEVAQNLLNYVVDTEEFQEEVNQWIFEYAEVKVEAVE